MIILINQNKTLSFYLSLQYNEAIKLFDKSIETNPQYPRAYNCKGISLIQNFEILNQIVYKNSMKRLNVITKLQNYIQIMQVLILIKVYNSQKLISLALSLMYNNKNFLVEKLQRYNEAIECHNKVLELDPQDAKTYYKKGVALIQNDRKAKICKLQKYNEAIECYNKSIQINPDNVSAYYSKGSTLWEIQTNF